MTHTSCSGSGSGIAGFVSRGSGATCEFRKCAAFSVVASAAGKPVAAPNLGSLPYVIEDGKGGILFEPGNVEELIEKVNHHLANPSGIVACVGTVTTVE